jgi:hypothetical protein
MKDPMELTEKKVINANNSVHSKENFHPITADPPVMEEETCKGREVVNMNSHREFLFDAGADVKVNLGEQWLPD